MERVKKEKKKFWEYCIKKSAEENKKEDTEYLLDDTQKSSIEKQANIVGNIGLKEKFIELFNKRSFINHTAGSMLFFVLVSLLIKNKKIILKSGKRLRLNTHFFWIQSSGSGKDQALDFLKEIIDEYNSTVARINVNSKKHYPIIKTFELSGTETVEALLNFFPFDDKSKRNDYTKMIKGVLEKYDLLISRECSYYFTEKRGEKQTKAELMLAALEGKPLERSLKSWEGHSTVTQSGANFIFTTRPFENIKNHIVNSGFQQRGLNYCRNVDSGIRKKMNKEVSLNAFIDEHDAKDFNSKLKEFVNELLKFHDFADEVNIKPENSSELNKLINDNLLSFYEDVENELVVQEHKEILNSFIARFKDLAMNISYLSALINFNKRVKLIDLQVAFDILKSEYDQLKIWVEGSIDESRESKYRRIGIEKFFYNIYHKKGVPLPIKYTRQDLVSKISKVMQVSESYAYRLIKNHVQGDRSLLLQDGDNFVYRE